MGAAICVRLRALHFAVAVRDIDPSREAIAVSLGCTLAATPAALAKGVDCLIVTVVDAAQAQAVLFGDDGICGAAHSLRPGAVVLLCPTIAADDAASLCQRLTALGLMALDCPMSGGPKRAEEGLLSLMIAGTEAAFRTALPWLQAMATRPFHVGQRVGDGARTKLVNNLLAAVNLAAAAEALALAQRLGLDPHSTLAVIQQSSGQSWIGGDRMARALSGDPRVMARVALLAKDSGLAMQAAIPTGLALPVSRAAAEVFQQALRAGLGDDDDAALLALALREPGQN